MSDPNALQTQRTGLNNSFLKAKDYIHYNYIIIIFLPNGCNFIQPKLLLYSCICATFQSNQLVIALFPLGLNS